MSVKSSSKSIIPDGYKKIFVTDRSGVYCCDLCAFMPVDLPCPTFNTPDAIVCGMEFYFVKEDDHDLS